MVFNTVERTLEELKINIEYEINQISSETLIDVSNNMIKRVKLCLECDGKQFQHLLK